MRGYEGFVDDRGFLRAHVWLSGIVQGVGFRAAMRREASERGVAGWVRNLPDGRVEAVMEGRVDAIRTMLDWCRRGPRRAHVTGVELDYERPRHDLKGFRIVG